MNLTAEQQNAVEKTRRSRRRALWVTGPCAVIGIALIIASYAVPGWSHALNDLLTGILLITLLVESMLYSRAADKLVKAFPEDAEPERETV